MFNNNSARYTLGASGGTNSLIIDASGTSGGTGSIAVAAGQHVIQAPVQLNSNTDFSAANPGDSLSVIGGVLGSGSLSMSGSGSVSIVNAAAGTIGNGITVNAGGQRTLGSSHTSGTSTFSGPITSMAAQT